MQSSIILALFWVGLAATPLSSRAEDLPVLGDAASHARVVIAEDARATVAFEAQSEIVRGMVDRALLKLTAQDDLSKAWRSLVSPKDVVGIKVYSGPGPNSGTRPAVAGAVIEGLLQAGISPSNIVIWDKKLVDLRLAGFDDLAQRYGVRLASSADAGYDANVFYDNPVIGTLVAGDLDFDRSGKTSGRKSYVTRLLTQDITKIINISPLLNHNDAGVCGNLFSLALGSVDNIGRFEGSPERLATAVPEIFAKPSLSDRVVLNITDALIGQYQGEDTSLLHYSVQLNQLWLSKDPVALDVLAIQELDRERQVRHLLPGEDNPDLYRNASFFLELGVGDVAKIKVDWLK